MPLSLPEFNEDLDARIHSLSDVDATAHKLTDGESVLHDAVERLKSLHDRLASLSASVHLDPVVQEIHTLQNDVLQHDHALEASGAALAASVEALVQSATTDFHALTEASQHRREGADGLESTKHHADESVQQANHELTAMTQQFASAVSGIHDHATQFQAHVDGTVDLFAHDVAEVHGQELSRVMDTLGHEYGDVLPGKMDQTFHMISSNVEHVFTDLQHQVDSAAHDLQDRASHMMDELKNHFTQTLHNELHAAFTKLIDDAMHEIVIEIGEFIAKIEFGTATTTALTPILPEILAAKLAAEALDEVTSIFS